MLVEVVAAISSMISFKALSFHVLVQIIFFLMAVADQKGAEKLRLSSAM
jgi:hypothetical protein